MYRISYFDFLAEFLSLCPIKGFDIPMLKKKSKILILMDHKSVKEKKLAVVFVDPPTQNCVIHHNKWRNEDLTVRRRAGLDKRKILMVFSFALVKLNLSSFGDLKAPKFGKAWKLAATSKVLWRGSQLHPMNELFICMRRAKQNNIAASMNFIQITDLSVVSY